MKPIARLYLTRQRLYEKECDPDAQPPENEVEEDDDKEECKTTEWGEWSTCSRLCGKGIMFRQRQYLNQELAVECEKSLVQEKQCFGPSRHCARKEQDDDVEPEELLPSDDERCKLEDDWSPWSSCSSTCGIGVKTRERKLVNPDNLLLCDLNTEDIEETEECQNLDDCKNGDEEYEVLFQFV